MPTDAPLLTQSDPGTENTSVAKAQSFIRQELDPSLQGMVQHVWRRGKMNPKPEIEWSKLRRTWLPGFEDLLDVGVQEGWYDKGNPIQA